MELIDEVNTDQWTAVIKFNNEGVIFKLDTVVDVTVFPANYKLRKQSKCLKQTKILQMLKNILC